MLVRLLYVTASLLALTASANAQGTCAPQDTPELGKKAAPSLFVYCVEDGRCGAVDKTGAWHVPPVHADVILQQDFIIAPENDEWTKLSFLSDRGEQLGGGEYSFNADEFQIGEGLFAVIVGEKIGYVDRTGKLVIPAEFDDAWAFSDGLAVVEKDGKRAYIDKTGKIALQPQGDLDFLSDFQGDVAVAGKADKYGLIDRTGAIVIEPKFDWLDATSGILVATDGDKAGIVGRDGAWIVKPEFDAIGSFSAGLAPAKKGEKWGLIDTCGSWKIEPKYDDAFGFEGGPAQVKVGEKWGLIDKSGNEVLPPTAAYISEQGWTDGLIAFSPDGTMHGLLDMNGKVVVEPKYNSIEPLGGGVLLVYVGEEGKLLNLDGSEIAIAPAP